MARLAHLSYRELIIFDHTYSVREARLALIERWAKRAMRHYKAPQPHTKKRRRLVFPFQKSVVIY